MRVLVLQLFNRKNRPSFSYISNDTEVSALLDSGSEAPVWCTGENKFLAAYPQAKKLDWKTEIYGFGKEQETASVFIIPEFILEDGKEVYKIINLQIGVCYRPQIGYDFVMSDTMFSKTNTTIYRIGKKRVELSFEKNSYHCAVRKGSGTFGIVTFSQDENIS